MASVARRAGRGAATHQRVVENAPKIVRGEGAKSSPAGQAVTRRPFCQASKVGVQPTQQATNQLGTAAFRIGPMELTASGGYIRRILLEHSFSGGAGSPVLIAGGDSVWAIPESIRLALPNNTPLFELSGFNTLLTNVYGGYEGLADPRADYDYNPSATNPYFDLFIPVELDPTGLGALSDLSSASRYQLTERINPSSAIWSTAPTTYPTLALSVFTEYWTLPEEESDGVPQEIEPPYAGTAQLWGEILNVSLAAGGGNQRKELDRMGNDLRTILMVTRSNGLRSDTPFPSPVFLRWDDVQIRNQDPSTLRKQLRELANGSTDTSSTIVGVYAFPYSQGIGRFLGGNGISSWLPTVTDTRYELSGTFGAATNPTLDWVVNEVTSVPDSDLERTQVPGGAAYYPPAPAPAANTM